MRATTFLRLRCPSFGSHLTWLHEEFHRWIEVLDWKDCAAVLEERMDEIPFLWIELSTAQESDEKVIEKLRHQYPDLHIFLCVKDFTRRNYQDWIQDLGIWQIGTPETDPKVWLKSIQLALEQRAAWRRQQHWLAACHNRNLRLVRMTHNLEHNVQRKTKKLFLSNQRLQRHESQLEQIKSLLVQINAAQDIKDIYTYLTKQLAGLLPYTELSIVLRDWATDGELVIKGTGEGDTHIELLSTDHEEVIARLFNGLEPVLVSRGPQLSELLKVPIFALQGHTCVLFLPLSIGKHRGGILLATHERGHFNEEVIETLRHLQPPLSVALDRVITMGALNHLRFQWEATFHAIPNPLFILSEEKRITRTNSSADQLLREIPEMEGLISSLAPRLTSQIKSQGREFTVIQSAFSHHQHQLTLLSFREITEEKELLQQLLQTEKLASVGVLSEKIAHELNNPLAGIMALSQLLQADFPEPIHSDLKEIEKACRRCKHIIENLVEFARSNGQKEKALMNLNEAIEETLVLARAALTGVSLEVNLESQLPPISGVFQELQQVLFNLIQNAAHSMHGKGSLTLATHYENTKGRVIFQIQDTGDGIPFDCQRRIFEPFFTTKRTGVGTGLGLSICKKIVEEHNGSIRLVRSEPKNGTEFELNFPVAQD